jgi:hypothetical protein
MALLAGPALVLSAPSQGEEVASRRFSSASRGYHASVSGGSKAALETGALLFECVREIVANGTLLYERHVGIASSGTDGVESAPTQFAAVRVATCGNLLAKGKGGHLRASVPSFEPQRAIEVAIGLTARGHAPLQAKAPRLLDEARDGIDPQTGA